MGLELVLKDLPKLETERLLLRKMNSSDAEELFAYCSRDEVSRFVSWDTHRTMEDTRKFLDIVLGQYENEGTAFWGIELKETQRLIGSINFVSLNWKHKRGEIGYILSDRYWGRGIMTEAAKAVVGFGFEKLHLNRIEAKCLMENIGSAKVLEKIGMKYEGVLRQYMYTKGSFRDLKLYAIVREDYLL